MFRNTRNQQPVCVRACVLMFFLRVYPKRRNSLLYALFQSLMCFVVITSLVLWSGLFFASASCWRLTVLRLKEKHGWQERTTQSLPWGYLYLKWPELWLTAMETVLSPDIILEVLGSSIQVIPFLLIPSILGMRSFPFSQGEKASTCAPPRDCEEYNDHE